MPLIKYMDKDLFSLHYVFIHTHTYFFDTKSHTLVRV